MRTYSLSHLSDQTLLHNLAALVARDRATTVELVAHIAEVDERRLYAPAGHPSMYSYCVHELRLSEDAALKRLQAARAAREFPAIFPAVAEGRLHLAAVCLLAPHLTVENVAEMLDAAGEDQEGGRGPAGPALSAVGDAAAGGGVPGRGSMSGPGTCPGAC